MCCAWVACLNRSATLGQFTMLPNHPDVFYEFVRTLKECGYRWILVQEHTVERVQDGGPVRYPHLPHRLLAKEPPQFVGPTVSIPAIESSQVMESVPPVVEWRL